VTWDCVYGHSMTKLAIHTSQSGNKCDRIFSVSGKDKDHKM